MNEVLLLFSSSILLAVMINVKDIQIADGKLKLYRNTWNNRNSTN